MVRCKTVQCFKAFCALLQHPDTNGEKLKNSLDWDAYAAETQTQQGLVATNQGRTRHTPNDEGCIAHLPKHSGHMQFKVRFTSVEPNLDRVAFRIYPGNPKAHTCTNTNKVQYFGSVQIMTFLSFSF